MAIEESIGFPYGELRRCQREAYELARDIIEKHPRTVGRKNFAMYATPGGGKTKAASVFAHELIRAGIVRRVVMLVPNDALRQQARDGFCDPQNGCDRALLMPSNETLKKVGARKQRSLHLVGKPVGYVSTFASVESDPALHLDYVTTYPTLVLLDEFHHFGESERAAWLAAVQPIVDAAEIVFSYTGTLQRYDERRIPWVRVTEDGNEYDPDIKYGRREALEEGAILQASFRLVDGEAVYAYRHEERSTLLSEASAKEASRALATALDDEEYAHAMALGALREWKHYRDTENPVATALVICHSIAAAEALARRVRESMRLGHDVVLAHSRSDDPTVALERFRRGGGKVLVTVGMASEGFDAPHLSHEVYLSKIMSPVYIAQAFARVVRPNRACQIPTTKQIAYIYAPKHPVLVEFIANYMEEQIGYFREFEKRAGRPWRGRGPSTFIPSGASVGEEHPGDHDGLLDDDDRRVWAGAVAADSTLKHRAPREVVALVRRLADLVKKP